MKAVQLFCSCLAFLPSIIYGITPQEILHQMAVNSDKVNEILEPALNGNLSQGEYGFIYKGTLVRSKRMEVVMKFTPKENKKYALKELDIFQYLRAKDNPKVKAYGIPTVYYSGQWKCDLGEYYVMAISLVDTELKKHLTPSSQHPLDFLITFREFVRIMKYIHSRGVYHGDIKIENFMFRKHRGFIIDFNKAKTIDSPSDTLEYAKKDWGSFLKSIGEAAGVCIDIDDIGNWDKTTHTINGIKLDLLRPAFLKFAKYLFENSSTFYEEFYEYINDYINEYTKGEIAVVSWLDDADKNTARFWIKQKPPQIVSYNLWSGNSNFSSHY